MDTSDSKRKQTGFKVFFNYLSQLRNLHGLRITTVPESGLLAMLRKERRRISLNEVTSLTVDCDGLEYLQFCPNIEQLEICCRKRNGRCYLTESLFRLADRVHITNVQALHIRCHGDNIQIREAPFSDLFKRVTELMIPSHCSELGVHGGGVGQGRNIFPRL